MRAVDFDSVFVCIAKYKWLFNFNINELLTMAEAEREEILAKSTDIDLDLFISTVVESNSIFTVQKGTKHCERESKKEYEIKRFIQRLEQALEQLSSQVNIVDVGCGQGNLISELSRSSLGIGRLMGVDRNGELIEKARKRFSTSVLPPDDFLQDSPRNISFVSQDFAAFAKELLLYDKPFGLLTLHGCGSLFEQIVNAFVANNQCKFMFVVPCCYNLIDLRQDSYRCLSERARRLQSQYNLFFDRSFLMLACQAPDHEEIAESSLRSITYRAILASILQKHNCKIERLRKINIKEIHSFEQYFELVCKRTALDKSTFDISDVDSLLKTYQHAIRHLWMLKCWLGLVAETAIVLDRICWLTEQGIQFECEELFERAKSSRNICFIARK